MTRIIEINDTNFNANVILTSDNIPVLVKFWGSYCQPCKRMEPILDNISITYDKKIKIFSVNVEKNQSITNKFNIRSIPSLLFFKNNNLLDKKFGFLNENQIKELIKTHFGI